MAVAGSTIRKLYFKFYVIPDLIRNLRMISEQEIPARGPE